MKFLFEFPGLAFFDCGGVRLMISRPEKPEFDHPGSVLYFKVNDIEGAHRDLASARAATRTGRKAATTGRTVSPPSPPGRAVIWRIWSALPSEQPVRSLR
jgi:hypothetical protein